jgi:hypothetical protein
MYFASLVGAAMMALHSIWRCLCGVQAASGEAKRTNVDAVSGVTPPDGAVGPTLDTARTELDPEPDFSEEFGYERGFAGGSGFEKVEFDKWV